MEEEFAVNLRRKLGQLPISVLPHRVPAEGTLDALRQRMDDILKRRKPKVRESRGAMLLAEPEWSDPASMTLPFRASHTAKGTVYQRLETLPRSYHVGNIPVDAAFNASAEILALLALDPSLAGTDPKRALYLDTETTGLGGGSGVFAFLVGMAWFDGDRLMMEQLLLRDPADEPAMLELIRERFEAASMLVTYNGKSFDLPLLTSRTVMNREEALPVRPHFDLLHAGRRLHRARLGVCRLVSLESHVLGFERGPDIHGADIAPLYGHFLRTGDEAALSQVVEHNAIDVVSLAALVGLYGEPLSLMHCDDLVRLARTYFRAGDFTRAEEAVEKAIERGVRAEAYRARGEISKARGDKARALSDYETLLAEFHDDSARFELAKLYEHFVRDPVSALRHTLEGTSEPEEARQKRACRLEKKIHRKLTARVTIKKRGKP